MPYSVFMGRVVAPGEPVWLEEDTQLAIEWQHIQDSTCKGCGQPLQESLEDAGGYEPELVRCFGCQAREEAVDALADRGTGASSAGVKVLVKHLP